MKKKQAIVLDHSQTNERKLPLAVSCRGTTRLPFLLALIGIFGGLRTFGLIGLFVGPVIMAAVLTVWREWVGIED